MNLDRVRRALARMTRPRVVRDQYHVPALTICFDDFPKTAWTEGGGVLRHHHARATYYMSGALCGSEHDGERMFDREDLEAVHAAGHEIGCHSYGHVSCMGQSGAEFARSVLDNQRFASALLGDVRLVSFAYPYGDTTAASKRRALAHFSSARGVVGGLNVDEIDLGQLHALGLESSKAGIDVALHHVDQAAAERAWLIVYTHDVQDHPSAYGCRPMELDRLLGHARDAGLEILTVKAALAARRFGDGSEGPVSQRG
jgi:peptidoglycan/xylan/chitin deacetylase (PgdA/CDA1 family)